MLLRNLDALNGLCNGTRLIVKSLMPNLIEATIETGTFAGSVVCIPKIKLFSAETDALEFQRIQFPIRLAFAMTINKAQGQTLDRAGLYLPKPVFSHGQLYVALSRVRQKESIKILIGKLNSIPAQYAKIIQEMLYTKKCSYKNFTSSALILIITIIIVILTVLIFLIHINKIAF